jgi:uncharacterized phiE125 gp8 family phage protein
MLATRYSLPATDLDFAVERSTAYATIGSGTGAPADEPVSAAELRTHLRLLDTAQDTYLDSLIKAARWHVENLTDRALPPQTLAYRRRGFPCSREFFELPRAPARAVSEISYINDAMGTADTLSPDVYAVDVTQEPARVYLKSGQSWPSGVRDITASVTVTYTAGWAAAASIPEPLRMAVLWLAAWWYEQRLPVNIGNIVNPLPSHLEHVLVPFQVFLSAP